MIAVVIPTIRTLDKWLEAWKSQLEQPYIQLYVIEDRDEKELNLPSNVKHYSRADIKAELGEDAWIISTFNSGIRSYGFYKAWQDKATIVITLDDDCYPKTGNEFREHLLKLAQYGNNSWINTITGEYPRGYPYGLRKDQETILNHGLWEGSPDLDAPTELQGYNAVGYLDQVIPKGAFFPMCIMNVAFRSEFIPVMYQLVQGKDWEYDRFDDIWSGLIMKKIADHLGLIVRSGTPHIIHKRQSNTFDNLIKEAKGIKRNETFWLEVDKVELTKETPVECYQEFWEKFETTEPYFITLKEAALIWIKLFR